MSEPPPLIVQAESLAAALSQWAKDDFKTVPKEVFQSRHSVCKSCDYWDPKGFLGLGRCKACGCSIAKLKFPGSVCPLPTPKWIEWEPIIIWTPASGSSDTTDNR